jgi:hypothetical protein
VFFDNILLSGHSFLKIEETNSTAFQRQGHRKFIPSHFDSSIINALARLLAELLPYRKHGALFCRKISRELKNEMNIVVSEKWLLTRLSIAFWQSKIYETLIRKLKTRVVVVSDTSEYGLLLACKRSRVPFVEIQHGVFDAAHPDAIPSWVVGTSDQLLLPDVLACRGKYWIDSLKETKQGNSTAVSVGSELIDSARAQKNAKRSTGKCRIVVSSQGADVENLQKWLHGIIQAAPRGLSWEMHIKLHPTYDSLDSPLLTLNRYSCVVVLPPGDETTIYDLLIHADLHVSISSACHFDAASLGVPSVVLPLRGHETVLRAIDSTNIHLAKNPTDVWTIVGRQYQGREEYYSSPNYSKNMIEVIHNLLEEPNRSSGAVKHQKDSPT